VVVREHVLGPARYGVPAVRDHREDGSTACGIATPH
jgi:hypothetical protein